VRWPRFHLVPISCSYDPSDLEGGREIEPPELDAAFEGEYTLYPGEPAATECFDAVTQQRLVEWAKSGEPLMMESDGCRFVFHAGVDSPPAERIPALLAAAEEWQRFFTGRVPAASASVARASFCTRCGNPLAADARFCARCGTPAA
jgi:hypothetical protein